ncbi:hypothetical protein J0S82_007600, partial [Galemys pyrenaicus]
YDFVYSLDGASRNKDDVLGSPLTITPLFLEEPFGVETMVMSPSVVSKLSWMTLARAVKQWGEGGIVGNLEGVLVLLLFHIHHKHEGITF